MRAIPRHQQSRTTPELSPQPSAEPKLALGSSGLPVSGVLGVHCFVGDVAEASEKVIDRALSTKGGYAVFCNVHVITTAKREPTLMLALEQAWAVFPDGAPVAWLLRRQQQRQARRVAGPDLMLKVVDAGRVRDLRHALFGSTPEVVTALRERLELQFPGVKIVEAYAPNRHTENRRDVLDRLAEAEPNIVWCALGAPKQELWMRRFAPTLAPALLLGVGAAFDFHSGTKPRAPQWMRTMGLEWLHRLSTEPRRLAARYIVTNSLFIMLSLRDRLARKSR